MKKPAGFCGICFISCLTLIGCQRAEAVQAASEIDMYYPRPPVKVRQNDHEMKGELIQVDNSGKTIGIRVENGMLQTFDVERGTRVAGLGESAAGNVQNLVGKEGSEVTVKWDDQGEEKIARNIEVTQVSAAKSARRSRTRKN